MGAGGASKFLNAFEKNPNTKAANILPTEADANPNVFYNASGQALSLKQIYNHFASKFNEASPVVDTQPLQSLPTSPVLAAAAPLQSNLPVNLSSTNSLAQIGNINITLSAATCNGLLDAANSNTASSGFSPAALTAIQSQAGQQNMAFLTQMALDEMAQSSSSFALKNRQGA